MSLLFGVDWVSDLTQTPVQTAIPAHASTEKAADSITLLPVEKLKEAITSTDQPTFVFAFASWCPYCKKQYPIIRQLIQQYDGKVQFRIISVDKNLAQLRAFMARSALPEGTPLYRITPAMAQSYYQFIAQAGGRWTGPIPYSALFSADGKIVAQFPGFVNKAVIERAMKSAQ